MNIFDNKITSTNIKTISMSIFFGFSDECGTYQTEKTKKHLSVHPHYIRSTLMINADEWKTLNNSFRQIKCAYGFPLDREIKWAYLWQLRNYQIKKQIIPSNKDFKFLEKYDYHVLIDFVEKCLNLLNQIGYKKIIVTHTDNANCARIGEKSMLKMHLQEHMQRIEMEIQSRIDNNLAILFFDPVCESTDKLLRDVYFDLFNSGDFIDSYKHIKDSLNIEHSHQSVGIQLSDYISGTFSSFLKGRDSTNYDRGKQMFYRYVYPNLRKNYGTIWGVGIREVPSNIVYRRTLFSEMKIDIEKINK
jgi:hypothetical protein